MDKSLWISFINFIVLFFLVLIILLAGVKTIKAEEKYFIKMDDEFWKSKLTAEQFSVLVNKGTEPAFNNKYYTNKRAGIYVCAACNNRLFSSEDKYSSGTGWPSFYDVITEKAVGTRKDNKLLQERTEVYCQRCGGHLGHVFEDGPEPTGLRYCMNSAALKFLQKTYFAMGCFWKPEALFGSLPGVYFTEVGYAGGDMKGPTYHNLGNHTEAIKVIYDPEIISYQELLNIFWENHNHTQKSYSKQYKSIIFCNNNKEEDTVLKFLENKKLEVNKKIYIDIQEIDEFYPAEQYHQKYLFKRNKNMYQQVIELFSGKYKFEDSRIAARLNAYSAGFLTFTEIKKEFKSSYLYLQYKDKIDKIITD